VGCEPVGRAQGVEQLLVGRGAQLTGCNLCLARVGMQLVKRRIITEKDAGRGAAACWQFVYQ